MHDILAIVIKTIIAVVSLLTTVLFLTSIIRRVYNERKYRNLDHLRTVYDKKICESLDSCTLPGTHSEFTACPKSNAWQAIENILLRLINEKRYRDEVQKLCCTLGYVSFHEKQIMTGSIQVRALSVDKLGRMKSDASVPKLIALLDDKNPEIVSCALRSLSKIGGQTALQAIVGRLPVLLCRSIVTSKAMGMALQPFGAAAIPLLIEQRAGRHNLWIMSCILDILSRLPANPRSIYLAAFHLSSTNVEVRSKALKVLGRAENIGIVQNLPELIFPLLVDPVWFVRLQAIRAIRALRPEEAIVPIGKLLIFDESWQVRNEAAQALTVLGEQSLDIFLGILRGADRYAKDSICEEIEKTDFSSQLIKNLKASNLGLQKKSREVLEIMYSLGFSTPFKEYLAQECPETKKEFIRTMMKTGSGV